MLMRDCWTASDEEALALIEMDPWALLISNGKDVPLVTAIPFLLDRSRGKLGTLVGHMARANPQVPGLFDGCRVLVHFQGPRAYVSPSWYPKRDMAPTMYHVLVEAEGSIALQDETTTKGWVERLTKRYEADVPDGWTMQELPDTGIARRMKAIIGFDIEITALRGKVKLGQDEPRVDALAVASRLDASDAGADQKLAGWIREKNQ